MTAIDNIALVLGGGGAKGAYQIGALYALSQYNLLDKVTAFSGASIGALNMALIQRVPIKEAINIWINDVGKIFFSDNINIYELMNMLQKIKQNTPPSKTYLADRKNLIKFFEGKQIEKISFTNKYLIASCVDVTNITEELRSIRCALGWYEKKPCGEIAYLILNYEEKESIYKILLASSAIPLIYEPVEINNKYYVDGGLVDNLPIKPVYDMNYKNIIAIPCNNVKTNIIQKNFPNSNLHIIKPSIDLGNLFSGTLNFSKDKIRQMINIGYKDSMIYIRKHFVES